MSLYSKTTHQNPLRKHLSFDVSDSSSLYARCLSSLYWTCDIRILFALSTAALLTDRQQQASEESRSLQRARHGQPEHTHTHTHTDTETQRHRDTETQTHRDTDTQTHRHTHTHTLLGPVTAVSLSPSQPATSENK